MDESIRLSQTQIHTHTQKQTVVLCSHPGNRWTYCASCRVQTSSRVMTSIAVFHEPCPASLAGNGNGNVLFFRASKEPSADQTKSIRIKHPEISMQGFLPGCSPFFASAEPRGDLPTRGGLLRACVY